MNANQTVQNEWVINRNAIATVDWPTASNSYNPVTTATQRLQKYMLDTLEAAITPIHLGPETTRLVIRATGNDNAATGTAHIFARKENDKAVKYVGSFTITSGTQVDHVTRYFAKELAVAAWYWLADPVLSPAETTMGMMELMFDTLGYRSFYIGFTAISSSDNVSIQITTF